MYELVRAGERTSYIECPAKVGVYHASDDEVWLIDSGNDKDAGRKIRQILDAQGWRLAGILITHSNADHIGGARYLQDQTKCPVFAPGIEAAFTRWPILEPSFLWGGYPCKDLRHKFLMAQGCDAVGLSDDRFPKELNPIPLPGHFFDMVGYRAPDGVVFLADCVSSPETLEKYGLPFLYDVGAYLATLDEVERMEAPLFVPAHAPATRDMGELVRVNRAKAHEAAERLLAICSSPLGFDRILQEIFRGYGLKMDFAQHVLVGSTVRSYLSWLKDEGKIAATFEDGMLLWHRA